ncbi:hypothetical protein SAMN05421690_1004106 [Nitrosomonas sp. Nm51]|uniref:hypothetical protein n=1 Tax=Nitrosomonas sp. Nm51 TaxID=133720 RepID=UPI0008AB481F|nr:hypothetical protein [Nitrosomonas sp. Nm51]SEQ96727.1 hypothetical protein SAMN05421690_1004106 [Nitrosomonas sp. Nm51]
MKMMKRIFISPPAGRTDKSNLRTIFSSTLCCNSFLILMLAVLLGACTTVPVANRNVASAGGFWEQDENTDPRFHHMAKEAEKEIGILYASGSSVLVNGTAMVEDTMDIENNSFVSTGPKSSARIEFKDDGFCSIQVEDFSVGNGYGDTANCEYSIVTTHATANTQDTIYHINVSGQRTEITVLRGLLKASLLADPAQSAIVNSGEEIILTADSIIGPRPVSFEEIERRIRWRDNYTFHTSKVSWVKVLVGAGVAAGIVAAILRGKSGGGSPPDRSTGSGPSHNYPD